MEILDHGLEFRWPWHIEWLDLLKPITNIYYFIIIFTLASWGLWKTRGWIISQGRLMSIALPNFMAPSLPLTDSLVCVTWNKSNWVNKAWCNTFSLSEMEFFANVHKKEIWVARPHHVTKSGAAPLKNIHLTLAQFSCSAKVSNTYLFLLLYYFLFKQWQCCFTLT